MYITNKTINTHNFILSYDHEILFNFVNDQSSKHIHDRRLLTL